MPLIQLFVGLELIGETRKDRKKQGFEGFVDQLLENDVFRGQAIRHARRIGERATIPLDEVIDLT